MKTPLPARFKAFSRVTGAIGMTAALLVLAGWLLDIAVLKSILPDWVSMKPNTALCFLLAGLALWLLQEETPATRAGTARRRLAQVCALAVLLIAALTLAEYLSGRDLHLDQLLFQEPPGTVETAVPGRMAPNTAFAFFFLGCALLLLDRGPRRGFQPAQLCGLMVAMVGILGLLGYGYGIKRLYGLAAYTPIAPPTALVLLLLAAGVLFARPDRGPVEVFTSESAGGVMARRLALPVLVLPVAVDLLALAAEREGIIGESVGGLFHAVLIMVVLGALVLTTAAWLERTDLQRRQAEEKTAHLAAIVEGSDDAILSKTLEGVITSWNAGAEKQYGYTAAEAVGRPISLLIPPDRTQEMALILEKVARGEGVEHVETTRLRKNGELVPVSLTVSPIRGPDGTVREASTIARDITERKRAEMEILDLNAQLSQRALALEAANKELEAFSYSVSHDLRAPLRSLDGFSLALLEDYAGTLDAAAGSHLQRIRAAAQRMGLIIDDLLKLSRVTRADLRVEQVDLSALARATADDLRQRDPGRGVEFVIADGLSAAGDPRLLRMVLDNLLGNAWKFTSRCKHARIEFGARGEDGGSGFFFVKDNGAGFDMAHAGKLFGAFQRLHGPEEYEGTGIGLATVQRIIHRHGGRVWAEGEVGGGATLFFTLGTRLDNGETTDKERP